MPSLRFRDLSDFGMRGVRQMIADADQLDIEMHREIHRRVARETEDRTPVAAVGGGDMKRSWHSTSGGSRSKTSLESALSEINRSGMKSSRVNDAAHARVIDAGKSAAHPHGSSQAPNGVSKPAMSAVESDLDNIRSEVIRRVLAK